LYGERYTVVIRRGKRADKYFSNADIVRNEKIDSKNIAVGGFSHLLQYAEPITNF